MNAITTRPQGPCPVCGGSGVRDPKPNELPFMDIMAGRTADGKLQCRNCGGQTMGIHGSGMVNLRDDGTPCEHDYVGRQTGNCYHVYTCRHCPDTYAIDSGD